jgi:hypothetical protein
MPHRRFPSGFCETLHDFAHEKSAPLSRGNFCNCARLFRLDRCDGVPTLANNMADMHGRGACSMQFSTDIPGSATTASPTLIPALSQLDNRLLYQSQSSGFPFPTMYLARAGHHRSTNPRQGSHHDARTWQPATRELSRPTTPALNPPCHRPARHAHN